MTLEIDAERSTNGADLGTLGMIFRQDVSELPEFRAACTSILTCASTLTLVDPQLLAGVRLKFDGGEQFVIVNIADELYVGRDTPEMGPFGIVECPVEVLPESGSTATTS
jgi:hypothetical protein